MAFYMIQRRTCQEFGNCKTEEDKETGYMDVTWPYEVRETKIYKFHISIFTSRCEKEVLCTKQLIKISKIEL